MAALAYLPPGEALARAMCAAPEGGGFRAAFHDLTITPRALIEHGPGAARKMAS